MSLAIYVRVSTQRQAQTQSIDQQVERLQTHCLAQQVPWQAVEIFRDDGYSGSVLKRPGLDRLRDRVAQGCIDRLLITAPDRLARKYVHQVLLIEGLERSGCQVEFVERPMSQDPHDQLLLQIRGAVAEYERTLIAERMRRGRLQKLQTGTLLPWTKIPYGYHTDPDRPCDPGGVRVEAAEAAVVAGLFAAYPEEGHNLCGLTRKLTEQGFPTPSPHSLESGNCAWDSHQSGLHRAGLCRPYACLGCPAAPFALASHWTEVWAPSDATGSLASRDPGASCDQPGSICSGPSQVGEQSKIRQSPQHSAYLSAPGPSQLWGAVSLARGVRTGSMATTRVEERVRTSNLVGTSAAPRVSFLLSNWMKSCGRMSVNY